MSGEFADDPSGDFDRNPADGGDAFGAGFDDAFNEAAPPPQQQEEDDPLRMLATALAVSVAGYRQRRRTLFEWMHPQRLEGFTYASWLPTLDARRAAQLAETWLVGLGMRPAPLLAFAGPSSPLSQLSTSDSLCALRMRALLDHVDELRSWIDRPRRQLLQQWLGADLARALLAPRGALAGTGMSGIGGTGSASGNPPLPAEPSADALAWRGFRLFERDCGWGPDHPMQLAQFALPDETALAEPLPPVEREKVSPASLTLIPQLSELFAARTC